MDDVLRDDLISRKEAIKLIEDMLNRPSIKANPDTANGLIGAHKIIWEMASASDKSIDDTIKNINALNAVCGQKDFYDEEFEQALFRAVEALKILKSISEFVR